MMNNKLLHHHRLLLFYKGDISALVLFAQQTNGSVIFPSVLPKLSIAMEPKEMIASKVTPHPGLLLKPICEWLQVEHDWLKPEPGFAEQVDSPGGPITVHMARFMLLDPPHQVLNQRDCRLRNFLELRGRPPAEMELLRRAYLHVMEG